MPAFGTAIPHWTTRVDSQPSLDYPDDDRASLRTALDLERA